MNASALSKIVHILSLFFVVIAGLYFAKIFLVLLVIAAIFAILLLAAK